MKLFNLLALKIIVAEEQRPPSLFLSINGVEEQRKHFCQVVFYFSNNQKYKAHNFQY